MAVPPTKTRRTLAASSEAWEALDAYAAWRRIRPGQALDDLLRERLPKPPANATEAIPILPAHVRRHLRATLDAMDRHAEMKAAAQQARTAKHADQPQPARSTRRKKKRRR